MFQINPTGQQHKSKAIKKYLFIYLKGVKPFTQEYSIKEELPLCL